MIDEAKKCTKSNLTEPFKQPCVPGKYFEHGHPYKGDNFYDFLFAIFHTDPLLKKGYSP